jgi:DNA processing protein
MGDSYAETTALVVLLRNGHRPPSHYADLVEEAGSGQAVLEQEHGLLTEDLSAAAASAIAGWTSHGIRVLTVLDPDYPENLRAVHDRPPLLFVRGDLQPWDERAVAVIGSRRASSAGLEQAKAMTETLVEAGYTVVSGLATGIDTAAHTTALDTGGRTIAVIGTGLDRCYPPQNAPLQRRVASEGAVVSQFWPDERPSRQTFPRRNAVMSGLSLATLIVEAGQTTGARIQARQALGHGRPVLIEGSLLEHDWARRLVERSGTHVVGSPDDLVAVIERIASSDLPVA